MAERSLCIFKAADSSQITRYADPSLRTFLLSYQEMFSAMQTVFLNSASALQELMQDRCVMENGFRITLDPEDAEKLRRQAELPDREDILLLTGKQDHLPRNWTIILFASGELMILPNWGSRFIISIRSPEMYQAFSAWFDVDREIALVLKKLQIRQRQT